MAALLFTRSRDSEPFRGIVPAGVEISEPDEKP